MNIIRKNNKYRYCLLFLTIAFQIVFTGCVTTHITDEWQVQGHTAKRLELRTRNEYSATGYIAAYEMEITDPSGATIRGVPTADSSVMRKFVGLIANDLIGERTINTLEIQGFFIGDDIAGYEDSISPVAIGSDGPYDRYLIIDSQWSDAYVFVHSESRHIAGIILVNDRMTASEVRAQFLALRTVLEARTFPAASQQDLVRSAQRSYDAQRGQLSFNVGAQEDIWLLQGTSNREYFLNRFRAEYSEQFRRRIPASVKSAWFFNYLFSDLIGDVVLLEQASRISVMVRDVNFREYHLMTGRQGLDISSF